MKKFNNLFMGVLVCAFMFSVTAYSQEDGAEAQPEPMIVTITTAHWNADSDVDFSDWEKTEKEFFDKVTSKNDLIVSSSFYTHYFTPDNSEVVMVNMYKSMADIAKANDASNKLIEAAWPEKDARDAFFDKQASYYNPNHSDEVYTTLPFMKQINTTSTEPLLFYVRTNKTGNGGKGYKEFFDNITMKNKYIKGFFTHRHRWGSDGRDTLESGVYDNLGDIERGFAENQRLIEAYWPDEEKRKTFFKDYDKYVTGHGDAIYSGVPGLSK
jgi:hypothetical protein